MNNKLNNRERLHLARVRDKWDRDRMRVLMERPLDVVAELRAIRDAL